MVEGEDYMSTHKEMVQRGARSAVSFVAVFALLGLAACGGGGQEQAAPPAKTAGGGPEIVAGPGYLP